MSRPPNIEDLISCSASLRRLARSILHDEQLAEDAVQDAMLAAVRHPPREERAVVSWLQRVTERFAFRRSAIEERRLRRDRIAARRESQSSAESLALGLERRRDLLEAVSGLPEPYRATIILRYFEEQEPKDIAEARGIPASTVRVHLVRGLRLLRARLESRFGSDGLHDALSVIACLATPAASIPAAIAHATPMSGRLAAALPTISSGVVVMKSKVLLAGLLLFVVAAFWIRASLSDGSSDQLTRTRVDEVRGVDRDHESVGAKRSQDQAPSPISPDAAISPPRDEAVGHVELRGSVIDRRRLPVERATVRLLLDGREIQTVSSDTNGGFRFRLEEGDRRKAAACMVHAIDATGRTAFGRWSRILPGVADVREFEPLQLAPAHEIDVRLVENGRPVPSADVVLELALGMIQRTRSDDTGHARFRCLPMSDATIRAWTSVLFGEKSVEIPFAGRGSIDVEMKASETVDLTVVERATDAPIFGAVVEIFSAQRTQSGLYRKGSKMSHLPPSPTDEAGHASLRIASGQDSVLEVRASGYHVPPADDPWLGSLVLVPSGTREFKLALDPDPIGRFRIVPGDTPPPAEGSSLRFVDLGRPVKEEFEGTARIEGPDVVVTGCGSERARRHVETPDGRLAELDFSKAPEDRETRFRSPSSVSVVVKGRDGRPIEGFPVALRPESASWRGDPPRLTDEQGCVTFDSLPGGKASILHGDRDVDGFDMTRVPIAVVDLDRGDPRIEIEVATPIEAVLHVSIGGLPGLPPDYFLYLQNAWKSDLRELPESGEIEITLQPIDSNKPCQIQFTAEGFGMFLFDVSAEASPERRDFDVSLLPLPHLRISVRPPADGAFDLRIQNRLADGRWNTVSGRIRTMTERTPLEITYDWTLQESLAGPLRVVDLLSGATGEPFKCRPGAALTETSFDLSRAFWLDGQIVAPPGSLHEARVIATFEGDPRPASQRVRTTGDSPMQGSLVESDGSFRLRLPGDRPISVSPWHPTLLPDPAAGSVVVTTESAPLVLRLAAGAHATFRIARPVAAEMSLRALQTKVLLYRGEATGEPLARLAVTESDGLMTFGGYEPGTYTVCFLLAGWAPLLLEHTTLRDAVTDLGDLVFARGTTLTIEPSADRDRRTRLEVRVRSQSGPPFEFGPRSLQPGDDRLIIPGLGPGRYTVSIDDPANPTANVTRIIEADGLSAMTIGVE